ncbi:MAG: RluA family pseudouridine synthase [Anaeromyxobacter sp.]|nr:RluA family pseudouridine synthase [Anaeromyxobacter sp.]MBL0278265.1 RluA family pseudouridine synthase [Anaeromyxobacter sp.]
MIELTVSADAAGQRLDKYVRRALKDVPLSHVYKMFRTRKVKVNEARGKPEQLLVEGDRVAIFGDQEKLLAKAAPGPAGRRQGGPALDVLFEDDDLFAVNKPAGLAAHPGTGITGATLVELVRQHVVGSSALPATEFKPSPAHRLDRETSGVILVAKNRRTMAALAAMFEHKEDVKKQYLTLVKGKMPRETGLLDTPLSEHEQTARSKEQRGVNLQPALTRWKVLASMKEASLLGVVIETGRTHQIRRHLQGAGHVVAGDSRYGDFNFNRVARARWALRRMFLHAWKLSLPHPVTGARLALTAPLPPELREVLKMMNLPVPEGA